MIQKNIDPADKKLYHLRHSLAHIMASAIARLYKNVRFGTGPVTENGFFYDIDMPERLTPEDLKRIEKEMRKIIRADYLFERSELTTEEAKKKFSEMHQSYKVELIKGLEIEGARQVSLYQTGEFIDLCRGGHVSRSSEIPEDCFSLTRIAGAYWKSDESREQLQRVTGIAFLSKTDLDAYETMLKEAEKRDHRKLGQELDLFAFDDQVGPGLPLWLPKGTVLCDEIEKFGQETEKEMGYLHVRTPHIAKESLYINSGHLPYYKESMFPPMNYEGEPYYLKAMNCPHHHKIFSARKKSYRDLPLRLAEYGTVYRHEKSGELFGLMRVRMMQMNDAHIYCTEEQFVDEFRAVNALYLKYFKIFGIQKYLMRFSTHAPEKLGKKYINDPKLWKKTEDMVRKTLQEASIPFVEIPDEAAFYGPKIDVQVWSAIGREFTLATNQVDFAVPARFGLTYTDRDRSEKTPLCIHRAPLSTHERFIGFLIEHYAGAFPMWLSPVQIAVLPLSEKFSDYAQKVIEKLKKNGIRVELKNENDSLGKRVRTCQKQKIPAMLILGEKEMADHTVTLRLRDKEEQKTLPLNELLNKLKKEIAEKK